MTKIGDGFEQVCNANGTLRYASGQEWKPFHRHVCLGPAQEYWALAFWWNRTSLAGTRPLPAGGEPTAWTGSPICPDGPDGVADDSVPSPSQGPFSPRTISSKKEDSSETPRVASPIYSQTTHGQQPARYSSSSTGPMSMRSIAGRRSSVANSHQHHVHLAWTPASMCLVEDGS